MSDQNRISPFKVNTLSSRKVKRIKKKISIRGLLSDPIHNSPNYHDKNCNEADSAENYYRDLRSERTKVSSNYSSRRSLCEAAKGKPKKDSFLILLQVSQNVMSRNNNEIIFFILVTLRSIKVVRYKKKRNFC